MSLPKLPDGWRFEASIAFDRVTVKMLNMDNFELASRSVPCREPARWETFIVSLADAMWADMTRAAQLGADLGILVIYE